MNGSTSEVFVASSVSRCSTRLANLPDRVRTSSMKSIRDYSLLIPVYVNATVSSPTEFSGFRPSPE